MKTEQMVKLMVNQEVDDIGGMLNKSSSRQIPALKTEQMVKLMVNHEVE